MDRQRFFAIFYQHQRGTLEVNDLAQMRHRMIEQAGRSEIEAIS